MPPHLLHVFPNFTATGPELRTVAVIGALGGAFEHSILSLDGRLDAAGRLPDGVPVRLLASPPRAGSLATARRLRQVIRRERPDLLLTYNWAAIDAVLAAASLGFRRVVHHEEGFNEDEAARFKRRRVIARRLLLPRVHRVVVPSHRLQRIATELWRLDPERVALIPNGVPLAAFSGAGGGDPELRRELGIPVGAPVVGSVGSLRRVKNFLRLLDAAAAVEPRLGLHVLLVGEGAERAALEARAARPDLAGRVHLAGYQAAPAPFYRAMDLFALTSDSEQMPVCLLEAMAAGLPVVATDVGDVGPMLPPEQGGWLVAASAAGAERTVAELARCLTEAIGDPARRRRLGLANRARVESTYAFEAACASYRDLYAGALAGARGKTGVERALQR
jgi:glycosyltransferase involved in cell wall biosynthesis